jgi:hypothetical protein
VKSSQHETLHRELPTLQAVAVCDEPQQVHGLPAPHANLFCAAKECEHCTSHCLKCSHCPCRQLLYVTNPNIFSSASTPSCSTCPCHHHHVLVLLSNSHVTSHRLKCSHRELPTLQAAAVRDEPQQVHGVPVPHRLARTHQRGQGVFACDIGRHNETYLTMVDVFKMRQSHTTLQSLCNELGFRLGWCVAAHVQRT